jgi:uncharacterized protein YbaR (Trm112 family)
MKERLLDLLACPTCGGDILLAYGSKYDGHEIIEGVLTCQKCTREYRVVRGVPRFADLGKIEEDKAETARTSAGSGRTLRKKTRNTTNSFSVGSSL